MADKTSYSFSLSPGQQDALHGLLDAGNYRPLSVPFARIAVERPGCRVTLYTSGKCLVQGRQAEDFVLFTLEPMVLRRAGEGYEDVVDPAAGEPHMGVDESGKGDFFGPLVTAAVYVDAALANDLRAMKVRDSKRVGSDRQAMELGRAIRQRLGAERFSVVRIGPERYNQIYARVRNVNLILSRAHARCIENILDRQPDCRLAVADQFGAKHQIENALMSKGRGIRLEQRHRAESDIAVAAASILARECFLLSLRRLAEDHGCPVFPKGASPEVVEEAEKLVRRTGDPMVLLRTAKCHFRTVDVVLARTGHARSQLGELGMVVSQSARRSTKEFRRVDRKEQSERE